MTGRVAFFLVVLTACGMRVVPPADQATDACVPETTEQVCARLHVCDVATVRDNCGTTFTVECPACDAGLPDAGVGDAGVSDAGTEDGGVADGGSNSKIVEVNGGLDGGPGGVFFDPVELAWRCLPSDWRPTEPCTSGSRARSSGPVSLPDGGVCAQDYPPCLEGNTFKVEDAIRALAQLPPLATTPLHFDGAFDVPNVDVTNTTLALMGTVADPTNNLVYSGSMIGRPPFVDQCDATAPLATGTCTFGKPVYVASKEFLVKLSGALHQEYDEVLAQGVVIIHVTDVHTGRGIAGAKIRHVYGAGTPNESQPELTEGLYYVSPDLSDSVHIESADDPSAVTSDHGLVVRLNAGNARMFTASLPDGTKFEQHLSGSRPGTAFELFFRTCAPAAEGLLQEGCPR